MCGAEVLYVEAGSYGPEASCVQPVNSCDVVAENSLEAGLNLNPGHGLGDPCTKKQSLTRVQRIKDRLALAGMCHEVQKMNAIHDMGPSPMVPYMDRLNRQNLVQDNLAQPVIVCETSNRYGVLACDDAEALLPAAGDLHVRGSVRVIFLDS